MPLNVRRFYTSVLLVLVSFILSSSAQTVQPAQIPTPQAVPPVVKTPTAGEIMRDRISKAKAFIAVRNYNAAVYELENIRRETSDVTVQSVVNVLLMNSYLEQGDYKRAQDFLTESFNQQKTTKPNAQANYFAVAGQIVKGARNRVERYRALGLSISDRTLPLEAVNDIEKMRETLELVITQSKDVGKDKVKTADAMALLEEAANSRSMMARDEYDARHWKDEIGDVREQITSSRSTVINAVNDGMPDTPANQNQVAENISQGEPQNLPPRTGSTTFTNLKPGPVVDQKTAVTHSDTLNGAADTPIVMQPVREEPKKVDDAGRNPTVKERAKGEVADNRKPNVQDPQRIRVIGNSPSNNSENTQKPNAPNPTVDAAKDSGPMDVGSLIGYATKQTSPVYPTAARSMRATGVVKVEVTVNENGEVDDVQKASGPALLQAAAKDAIRKWRFRPFVRDGQPVKATGFVSFNFAL